MRKIYHDQRLKHWYVCFSDSNVTMPLQRFLKKGFKHVHAFAYDAKAKCWLTFDPGWDGIVIRAITDPKDVTRMFTKAYVEGPILYCEMRGETVWKPRIVVACTSQICHLLGENLLVHTPYRLFCALKKRGATTILFED